MNVDYIVLSYRNSKKFFLEMIFSAKRYNLEHKNPATLYNICVQNGALT